MKTKTFIQKIHTTVKTMVLLSGVFLLSFAFSPLVNAGNSNTGSDQLNHDLQMIVDLLSGVIGIVIVISIIIAGIQYMTAGSNSSQVSAAKNRISMAILSLILFGFAFALLQWLVPGGIFNG